MTEVFLKNCRLPLQPLLNVSVTLDGLGKIVISVHQQPAHRDWIISKIVTPPVELMVAMHLTVPLGWDVQGVSKFRVTAM